MNNQQQSSDVLKLDANMSIPELDDQQLEWYSPLEQPFYVAGFGWLKEEQLYRRLPTNPAWTLPEAVDNLANCTAGGQIRFTTNAVSLSIKVKLTSAANMYHMPATGQCGFDCYIGEPGEQFYYSTTRYDLKQTEYESVMFTDMDPTDRSITLNFPLYQGVQEVWIGLNPSAQIAPPPAYDNSEKILLYGTSITQGGCATRPGMAYPNILSRRVNMEFLNLGFSGNGKGEPELAHMVAEIPDPACLVLDYEANCVSTESLQKTLPEFIRIYRNQHPDTPILVISCITYAKERYSKQLKLEKEERKGVQLRTVEQFRENGDANIYFYDGSTLLGENAHECTVDGVHPTDLGFLRMADGLTPVLKKILA
ncbi:SGNH/GDSL hydrolase family protein [Paenibacillus qinlingensis]|uniref:SGNH/GDSL hydrolase family protein n=1 Tax=Paenibacillus qinlingensis TaxID=1837343 RepID=UPI00156334B1|nr:SGNH/GDSL hydrolase family protein [Paenibacillus qinlingensis]NQX60851.1 SGNH/GDSL hydrolase family protein [Paenibacillus qinlingensis]